MDKIKNILIKGLYLSSNIAKDKLGHFFGSYLLLVVLSVFMPLTYAYTSLFFITVLKDVLWDKLLKKGKFEAVDIFYGILPIAFDIIIHL